MTAVLELEADARRSRNGSEQVREEVMAYSRRRARELADEGFSVREIEGVLAQGLNHTEQEILWLIASHEVDGARRPKGV